MIRYEIIIYWSQADQAFVAEVPELPGSIADGKTYEKAITNAQIVIAEWIEAARSLGRSIPAPKGLLIPNRSAALARLEKGLRLKGERLTREQAHERNGECIQRRQVDQRGF